MNEATRPVRRSHRGWVAAALAALSLALLVSGCGNPLGTNSGHNHACADKVALATTGVTVPGMWKCISPDFQKTLNEYGMNGDGAFGSSSPGVTVHPPQYVGYSQGIEEYTVSVDNGNGHGTAILGIYVNPQGLATNVAVGAPIF